MASTTLSAQATGRGHQEDRRIWPVEPAPRAKEDQVLSHARRAVALAVTAAAAALPLVDLLLDGAKRWNG